LRWTLLLVSLLAACTDKDTVDDTDTTAADDTGVTDVTDTGDALDTADTDDGVEEGTTDTGGDWEPRFNALAEALEADRIAGGAPGLAAAVFEGDDVPFMVGYGDRHPESGGPVSPATLFRIGSVNKMLTAAALLQKVEDGLLDLDAVISEVEPELDFSLSPGAVDVMTVEHLLTHEGGLYDYLEIDYGPEDELLEEFLMGPLADGLPTIAPPGRMYNYSNPNFYYAGLLTERVDTRFYREILTEDLFEPLGMNRTYFLGEEVLADGNYASGATYDWTTGTGSAVAEPDSYDNGWGRPAGYAWSSVLDMTAFAQFLLYGDEAVLSDTLREAMSAPQVDMAIGTESFYGYGLSIQQGFYFRDLWYDLTIVTHDGAIPGFSASMYYFPELELGMVALANTDGAYPSASLGELLELAELPEPGTPPDWSVDPERNGDFVGYYEEPWNVGDFEVSLAEDGRLLISMPTLDRLGFDYDEELLPYTPDNFVLGIDGTQLLMTFIRDEEGASEYARTRAFVGALGEAPSGPGGGGPFPSAPPSTPDVERIQQSLRAAAQADARTAQLLKPLK